MSLSFRIFVERGLRVLVVGAALLVMLPGCSGNEDEFSGVWIDHETNTRLEISRSEDGWTVQTVDSFLPAESAVERDGELVVGESVWVFRRSGQQLQWTITSPVESVVYLSRE